MKLERTLIELTTLVDYGTRYLLDVKSAYDKGHDDGVDDGHCDIDMLSLGEFMEHTDMSSYDVLDYIDSYDVKDYVKDNFDVDDVYDADEILNNMDIASITDYVSRKIAIEDMVKWR